MIAVSSVCFGWGIHFYLLVIPIFGQRLRLLFLLSIILWGSDTLHESNLELIGAMKVLWASQILGFVIFKYINCFQCIVYSVQAFFVIYVSDHFPGSLFLLNLLKVET